MKLKMNMSCSSLSEKRETVRFQQILVVSCTVFFAVCSNSLYAAANHYIREGASGADTGSNWTDAWDDLPASLIRGDTYYIADGLYGGYTFDDAVDGSTYITIKKAKESDHGDPYGWNSSYGDGVAEWVLDNTNSSLHFQTGYYVFDGVVGGGPGNWDGGSNSHGFKIYPDSGADTTNFHLIEIHNGSNPNVEHPDYIEIKHCEITSPYRQSGDAGGYIGDHDYAIFQSLSWWYWTGAGDRDQNQGPRNVTISYNYIHDVYQHLYSTHTQDWIIEYNYMARNDVDWIGGRPSNQGTGIFDYGSDNWIIRYNIFEDMSGTGFIDVKKNANHDNDNWAIYGNVFWYTPGYNYAGGLGNGAIVIGGFNCTEETPCATTNMKVYNNAFVNLRGGSVGVFLESYPSTNNWVYNNIFFDTERNWNGMFWSCEHSHNSFISNTGGWSDATIAASEPGTGYAGTDDPFTDWANMDFTLKSATTAGNTLASPYNQDWTGVTRGADGLWDRGVYEYSSSTADIAIDDSITINEDSGLNTIDVLDNDIGEGLAITSVTQGDNGSVSHDGIRVTYEAEQDFFGTDSFTYTVNDGSGFDIGHVTVTVINVNDEPEATDDSAVISKNSTAYTIDVLANDSDPDGDSDTFSIISVSQGSHGIVAIAGGGTELTYTPNLDYVGSDIFNYTISDGSSTDTATVSVTVTNFDDSGLVGYWTFDETTGTVAADISGNANDATLINGPTWAAGKVSGALDFDGMNDYVDCGNDPSLDLTGDLSIGLWFHAREWNNNSWPALISKRDSYTSMNWELFYYRDLNSIQFWYGNAGAHKLFSDLNVNPSSGAWHHLFITREGNTWTLYMDGISQGTNIESGPMPIGDSIRIGTFEGTHAYFDGMIDDIRMYNLALSSDEILEVYSASTSANNPPTAGNDSAIVDEDSVANTINVLANDTDADGDTLTITSVTQATNGSVAITGGGMGLAYTPTPDYNGPDSFTYTISDGQGGIDTATVSVTVTNVPDDPILGTIGDKTINENQTLTITVNATDADGDTLEYSVQQLPPGATFASPFVWTPTYDDAGTYEVIFIASDGSLSDSETIIITVNNVNRPPVAVDDSAVTNEDNAVTTGNVFTNDTDADGHILGMHSATPAVHGTSVYNNNGTFTYTPPANYNGSDSFTYTVSDNNGGTATATVNIEVTPINDPPDVSAIPDTLQKYENESILPQDVELATDVDSGDTLTYTYPPDLQAADYILHVDVSDGTVTVGKDVTIIVIPVPPTVISATATKFSVEIIFSEELEQSSARNVGNYTLSNGILINVVALNAEHDKVALYTSGHAEDTIYTLTITGVEDLAGNSIAETNNNYTYDAGLIGLWNFNTDGGNTALDASGYDNTATLVNGPVWTEQGDLNFDGIDDAVEIPTNYWNTNSGTVALWAYAEDLAGTHHLFGHTTGSGNNRIQLYTLDQNLNLGLGNSDELNIENLDSQAWHHFALTWDGTNYVVYVDGIEKSSGFYTGLNNLSEFADIGNSGDVSFDNAFAGHIDDARVYERALTPDEVVNVYLMSDESIRENKALAFEVSATYADGTALIYSDSDPNLLLDDALDGASFENGTFTWNPWYDQAGIYDITFLPADQEQPQFSQTVTVAVEDVQLSDWYQSWLEHIGLL